MRPLLPCCMAYMLYRNAKKATGHFFPLAVRPVLSTLNLAHHTPWCRGHEPPQRKEHRTVMLLCSSRYRRG
eukprot:410078-Pelagomonas_calceolata.AAC.6